MRRRYRERYVLPHWGDSFPPLNADLLNTQSRKRALPGCDRHKVVANGLEIEEDGKAKQA